MISMFPIPSINLMIRDDTGLVLLSRGNNYPVPDYWFVPGGRILKNETIDEAICRISCTEIGREITRKQVSFQGIFEHLYSKDADAISHLDMHFIVLMYQGFMDMTTELKEDTLYSELKWWSVEELMVSTRVHSHTKSYFF